MGRHRVATHPRHRRSDVGTYVAVALAVAGALGGGLLLFDDPDVPTAAPSDDVSTSAAAAPDTPVPPSPPLPASPPGPAVDAADPVQTTIVNRARDYADQQVPYRPGGKTDDGFDSPGLVWQVLNAAGLEVPYRTAAQLKQWVTLVDVEDLQPGDLVFYARHVAVYVGDGQVIDASPMADHVTTHALWFDPPPTFGRVPAPPSGS